MYSSLTTYNFDANTTFPGTSKDSSIAVSTVRPVSSPNALNQTGNTSNLRLAYFGQDSNSGNVEVTATHDIDVTTGGTLSSSLASMAVFARDSSNSSTLGDNSSQNRYEFMVRKNVSTSGGTIGIRRVLAGVTTSLGTTINDDTTLGTTGQYRATLRAVTVSGEVRLLATVKRLSDGYYLKADSTYTAHHQYCLVYTDNDGSQRTGLGYWGVGMQRPATTSGSVVTVVDDVQTAHCTGYGLTITEQTVPAAATATLTLTGLGTTWVADSPTFTLRNTLGGTVAVSAISITSDTTATLTVTTGTLGGILEVYDPSTGLYATGSRGTYDTTTVEPVTAVLVTIPQTEAVKGRRLPVTISLYPTTGNLSGTVVVTLPAGNEFSAASVSLTNSSRSAQIWMAGMTAGSGKTWSVTNDGGFAATTLSLDVIDPETSPPTVTPGSGWTATTPGSGITAAPTASASLIGSNGWTHPAIVTPERYTYIGPGQSRVYVVAGGSNDKSWVKKAVLYCDNDVGVDCHANDFVSADGTFGFAWTLPAVDGWYRLYVKLIPFNGYEVQEGPFDLLVDTGGTFYNAAAIRYVGPSETYTTLHAGLSSISNSSGILRVVLRAGTHTLVRTGGTTDIGTSSGSAQWPIIIESDSGDATNTFLDFTPNDARGTFRFSPYSPLVWRKITWLMNGLGMYWKNYTGTGVPSKTTVFEDCRFIDPNGVTGPTNGYYVPNGSIYFRTSDGQRIHMLRGYGEHFLFGKFTTIIHSQLQFSADNGFVGQAPALFSNTTFTQVGDFIQRAGTGTNSDGTSNITAVTNNGGGSYTITVDGTYAGSADKIRFRTGALTGVRFNISLQGPFTGTCTITGAASAPVVGDTCVPHVLYHSDHLQTGRGSQRRWIVQNCTMTGGQLTLFQSTDAAAETAEGLVINTVLDSPDGQQSFEGSVNNVGFINVTVAPGASSSYFRPDSDNYGHSGFTLRDSIFYTLGVNGGSFPVDAGVVIENNHYLGGSNRGTASTVGSVTFSGDYSPDGISALLGRVWRAPIRYDRRGQIRGTVTALGSTAATVETIVAPTLGTLTRVGTTITIQVTNPNGYAVTASVDYSDSAEGSRNLALTGEAFTAGQTRNLTFTVPGSGTWFFRVRFTNDGEYSAYSTQSAVIGLGVGSPFFLVSPWAVSF